jgi:hypothetical protein
MDFGMACGRVRAHSAAMFPLGTYGEDDLADLLISVAESWRGTSLAMAIALHMLVTSDDI